jgi:CRP-like cAMP-binding protein
MSVKSNVPGNRLLRALSPGNFKRIAAQLETIPCEREQILIEADSSLDHVFFPDSGVVSMMALYSDGSVIELATIGREGFASVRTVFGAKKSVARFFVQIPGSAAKMSRAAFRRAMKSMPFLQSPDVCLRPGLSRSGLDCGGMQWHAQPQTAVGALVTNDA